jgi:HSP20 family protein
MLPALLRRRDNALLDPMDFDRLFDFSIGRVSGLWSPPADVRETEDGYLVEVELPGLTAEAVDVSVENGVLSISGEKRTDREEGSREGGRYLIERRYGRFQRHFTLPNSVDGAKVAARFENGVLVVDLPKAAGAKPRKVKVS